MRNRYRSSQLIAVYVVLALLETCDCNDALRRLLQKRRQRALVYPDPKGSETKVQVLFGLGLPMEGEVSMTLGYVVKCNYNLPYNSSQYSRPPNVEFDGRVNMKKTDEKQLSGASRWSLYRLLESAFGKSCLLRAVCEAAESPLVPRDTSSSDTREGGLAGQLLHALLTPSMTSEEYEIYADREYRVAESIGGARGCGEFYRDCPSSPLEYFTRIMDF